ncbi:MAG: porin [bacterium]
MQIGRRDRWGAELHYIGGSFNMSSEYLVTEWRDLMFSNSNSNGRVASWGTWVSLFLTGEKKQVGNFGWKQPKPNRNFDPVNHAGVGAWEILCRYTRTETSKSLFDSGLLIGASQVDEFTFGVCWTWNPMVRWQLNYVHLAGEGIQTGSNDSGGTRRVDQEDFAGIRMVFKF